jgi:glycosyltransferase involved in cell wall biosynthesis
MNSLKGEMPTKVLLVIRSLHIGGSERQVVALVKSMADMGTEVHVALKISGGPLEDDLSRVEGDKLHHLGGMRFFGFLQFLFRLRSLIYSHKFDAVYSFLPGPNLMVLVSRMTLRRPFIAWGVRSSGVDMSQYSVRYRWAVWLEKQLSVFSDRIITNSQKALEEYRLKGYGNSKLIHIPNAIDVRRFIPDPDARQKVEIEFEISHGTLLIGLFARIHPMKDYETFVRAAKILADELPNVRFICAGGGAIDFDAYGMRIKTIASELGLDDKILWVGPRLDPEVLMAACDLTTLTSDSGEGFPNSVAESLACGTPCVVTDVGDAAVIVGNSDAVVPRADPARLARAWKLSLELANKEQTAVELRQSIIDRYSPAKIATAVLETLRR